MNQTRSEGIKNYFHSDLFTVERATQRDIPELMELINHAFQYQDEAKGMSRIDSIGLQKKMEKTEFYIWRDATSKLAACCYVAFNAHTAHFGLLAVSDDLRRKGLAPSILAAIEAYALGNETLELDYMSLSPWLDRYYERYGFEKTGLVEDIKWSKLIRMQKRLR